MMRTLSQMLGEHTEQQLEQIATWWGIGGIDSKPEEGWRNHHGLLVQKMQDPTAARFVWEHLSDDERKVLYNILSFSASNGIIQSVIMTFTRLPKERFEAALATLTAHLLVLEESKIIKSSKAVATTSSKQKKSLIPTQLSTMLSVPKDIADALLITGREMFTANYDRSTFTLEKNLSMLGLTSLYEIGRLYGIVLNDYYSRTNPSSRLAGHLVQPEVALYAWDQFDAATRKLCKWLCDQGGKATLQAARKYTGYDDPTLSDIISKLERYAIAFDTFSEAERKLFVPREMLKNLKKAVAQPESVQEQITAGLVMLDTPPQTIRSSNTLMLYDLAMIIGAIYQQNIEPTKSGNVPKRIASKLQPMLQTQPRVQYMDAEYISVDLLFNVAQQLGLVKLSRSSTDEIKQRYESGPQLEQWSQMDIVDQTHDLVEFWQKTRYWVDIAGANFDASVSTYFLDLVKARGAILKHLSRCIPGRWYSVDSLLRTMKAEDPFLLRSNQSISGLMGYRNTKVILANWDRCEGEVIIGLLASTLFELGIVSLGYMGAGTDPVGLAESNKPVNPVAFMLTDLVVSILSTPVEPPSPADTSSLTRTLIVQPNFELLLLQPDFPTLYSVLPFAQLNQVGIVSRLTLTRSSVLRGMEAGKNSEQIVQLLEERSQKELPQNVVYTLRDWTKLYKEAAVSQVLLIEVTSEALANEICASPKLKTLGLRRLGPCAIAVSDVGLQELRRALDKEGFVVRIIGDIVTRRDSRMFSYGMSR